MDEDKIAKKYRDKYESVLNALLELAESKRGKGKAKRLRELAGLVRFAKKQSENPQLYYKAELINRSINNSIMHGDRTFDESMMRHNWLKPQVKEG